MLVAAKIVFFDYAFMRRIEAFDVMNNIFL